MIPLILDSNIWIEFLAKDQNGIYTLFKKKIDEGEVYTVTNSIIIDEWKKNREKTIKKIIDEIKKEAKPALKISSFLGSSERTQFEKIIKKATDNSEKIALQRIKEIEKILFSSPKMKITSKMKMKAVEHALLQKAPFINKNNSVADAIIIFSAIEYFKVKDPLVRPLFVSFNHTDYSDLNDKDIIHPDLDELLKDTNIQYKRNIADALNLAPQMITVIDNYIEDMIESWINWQAEIMRGK